MSSQNPRTSTSADARQPPEHDAAPLKIRLPGFIVADDIGLGDAIRKVSYRMGIKPCSGCDRRAESLNRIVRFSGRTSKP